MESMASGTPSCSLEKNLASGAGDSSAYVSKEFRNPKIGNMDGCRKGILVEEGQVSGNSGFVRGGGDYYPLSNGDCEGAGVPGTAGSLLWGNWEDSGNSGSVRQSGDSSLSNSDFEGPEADFDIEGSGLRGNRKDGEDFMVDYLGSKIHIDCDIDGSGFRGNWKDGEDFMVDYLGSKIRIDCTTVLLAVADWMNTLHVERENFKETACYREMYQDFIKRRPNEDNATLRKGQLTSGSDCGWYAIQTCPVLHKATCDPVSCYEPLNLNELIGYGDYETICWDAIEATRVEHRAPTCDLESCYEDGEPVKHDELLDKIETMGPSYNGAHLTSLKAGALLSDFQASGEAGLRGQLEENNDRWQESPAKIRDVTGNIRVQAALEDLSTALEDLSMKTSAYSDSCQIAHGKTETVLGSTEGCSDGEEPHDGLFLTLSYLGLQDLMSIEKVCKSLHAAVKNDPLLWQSIHVEHPLSERVTDDALLKLAARSQGHLRKLSLVECLKITDDGLKQVLDISPKLTKLCLPGCTRLTADGIVNNVKAHRECSKTGLKQLRVAGLFGITREHLEKLNYLLDSGLQHKSQSVKPRFYPNGRHYSLSYDDDSTIDIEACPKCGNARLVYDCTNESCQNQRDHTVRECRACTFCIARCDQCGRCIDGSEYEETFCLDRLCADCVRAFQLPRTRRASLW